MATRSHENNPEQKTKGAHITEFSDELNPVKKAKQNNLNKKQVQKSKQSGPENKQ